MLIGKNGETEEARGAAKVVKNRLEAAGKLLKEAPDYGVLKEGMGNPKLVEQMVSKLAEKSRRKVPEILNGRESEQSSPEVEVPNQEKVEEPKDISPKIGRDVKIPSRTRR